MILSLVFLENSAFFLLICLCYHTELILLENDCDNFLVIGIFDKFPLHCVDFCSKQLCPPSDDPISAQKYTIHMLEYKYFGNFAP